MESFLQDAKYALRQLRMRPTFTFVAIAVLALGIGAATAIFSVLDTLVIRALPYEEADRIVTVWKNDLEAGVERDDVAPADFFDWKEQAESFQALGALDPYSLDLTGRERPEVVYGARVTEGFFEALGTRTLYGRTLVSEDFVTGNVVVIGERLWERRFGSDPNLVGEAVLFDGVPTTVVGILPRSFNPHLSPSVQERDAWIPMILQGWELQSRGSGWWNVVGRLAPGVSLAQAQAEMEIVAGRLAEDYPETNSRTSASVVPLRDHLVGNAKTALVILQAAVLFLLLVACANVASLFLARGAERESEFAVRAALGAGRLRLIRQLLTESVAIALAGAVCGVVLAFWALDLIVAIGPAEIPRLDEVALDGRVLAFALAVTGVTALAFGVLPSIHFSQPDLQSAIKEGRGATAGRARQRIRSAMVVAEVALSLILVVGAGLLARSFVSLLDVDPGFDQDRVAATQVFYYPDGGTPQRTRDFYAGVVDEVRAMPGVTSAGAVSALPFIEANLDEQNRFEIEGRAAPRAEEAPNAFVSQATEGYFATMGIPILAGRTFDERDRRDTAIPVTIVTEGLTRRYWPNQDPIGERLLLDGVQDAEGETIAFEIVGVVGQVRHDGLDRDPRPELFLPHSQVPTGGMTFVARTSGDPQTYLDGMAEAIWAADPTVAIYRAATLKELLSKSVAARRFNLWLLGAFAAMALLLAGVGIYGVVSYMARTRIHEIGVRMALGAGRTDVLREVMNKGVQLTSLGIGLGLIGSLGLTSLMSSLLYETSPRDPLTLFAVAVLLALIALLAMYLPARRATSVDPSLALRVE